jgi:CRISPR-associated protein Csb2
MARTLCLSATFLTGRYHGREWPPSPARLVQALVAGVKAGGNRRHWDAVEPLLLWMERRPAPLILARPADALQPYRIAVPNNDMDQVAREWLAGGPGDPSKLRTMKSVKPRLVSGDGPHVRYLWSLDEDETAPDLAVCKTLAHCLYSLGWGIDMAYADADLNAPTSAPDFETWTPSRDRGERLPVPVPGFLADLEETYGRFVQRAHSMDTDTRPTVYRLQRYSSRDGIAAPYAVFSLRRLDRDVPFVIDWRRCMEVAAWLRHAASQALLREPPDPPIDINAFVLGHSTAHDGGSAHMAFVPLPSIGHAHADGYIRRVMLVEPLTADGAVVDLLNLQLPGTLLTPEAQPERPICLLAPLSDRSVVSLYTRKARRWRSVTPVILHGYNAARGRISLAKTDKLLRQAFAMAGHDPAVIESIAFQPAPLWPNLGAAAAIRVPAHLQNYPRYHVEVLFRAPVAGPILAGIGRHYGIGLFAAGDS